MALFTKFSRVFSSQNFCNNLTTISGYNTVLLQINKVMVLQFNFITLLFGLNIKVFKISISWISVYFTPKAEFWLF